MQHGWVDGDTGRLGGFTDEIGATAFAEQLVAVKTRYEEVKAISTPAFEDFAARFRGSCQGGKRDLDAAGRHQNSRVCPSAPRNHRTGHRK